ncbi:cold-regulated protein 27-like isoform X2 [Prosopis cineraria]|uniref:cold-regulated protein 27-like isoform X2 n=1 Tax=Prosopis cineraria TaxID=364024 RepID=UPI00240ED030|nr:cold-regulated protein 27-like isoform X2 [Prosopis cineraria]
MEEEVLQNVHSPLSDPEPFDSCGTELTRMNSDSSAITLDASKTSSPQCAAPFPLTKWTDHQHRLYLNSLEASFVNELHQSIQLRGWSLRRDSKEAFKSKNLQNSQNMTKQFPVMQDCCWKKICVERNEPMLESTADSHVLAGSSSILAPVARGCITRESDVYDYGMLCDEENCVRGISKFSRWSPRIIEKSCHRESVGCPAAITIYFQHLAEATDQNFKNEDQGATSSCMPMTKRLKTATAGASSNDQVVPSGNFHRTDVSSNINPLSENEGQDELLSELPESFHDANSVRHPFLRGS